MKDITAQLPLRALEKSIEIGRDDRCYGSRLGEQHEQLVRIRRLTFLNGTFEKRSHEAGALLGGLLGREKAIKRGVRFFVRRQADECAIRIALDGITFQFGERQTSPVQGTDVRTRTEEQDDRAPIVEPAS
ncbi:MAG: hypothetical protein ACXW5J_06125 [Thermoanaerobaculia bacterium]